MATQTSIVENRPPAYLEPYHKNLAAFAQHLATQPYTPYGGQRIAGFTPMENMAYMGIGALGMAGAPQSFRAAEAGGQGYMGMAGMAPGMGYNDLSGMSGQFQQLGNQMGNVQTWPNANIQAYMNPYIQNVTDIAARNVQSAARQQMSQLGSGAALRGAFGGDRQALQEANVMRGAQQQIGDIAKMGQAEAYAQGIGAFQADRDALMRGQMNQLGAYQSQADALGRANQLYQSGLGLYGQGVNMMAGLGQQSQDMAMQRLGAMQQAGQQQRGLQQAMLDTGYQDYLRQQNYGMDRANFLAGILGGQPFISQNAQFTTMSQQNPNLFNAALGTGITGLSMYNQNRP